MEGDILQNTTSLDEEDLRAPMTTPVAQLLDAMNKSAINTTELPEDMKFNSSHVISIVGYSTLFLVSSVCNCTVLMILIRRYKKTKSRVNLLLIHLAIAGKTKLT